MSENTSPETSPSNVNKLIAAVVAVLVALGGVAAALNLKCLPQPAAADAGTVAGEGEGEGE